MHSVSQESRFSKRARKNPTAILCRILYQESVLISRKWSRFRALFTTHASERTFFLACEWCEVERVAKQPRQQGILKNVTHVGRLDADSKYTDFNPFIFLFLLLLSPFSLLPIAKSVLILSAPVLFAISSQINQTFESCSTHPHHPSHSASTNPATSRKLSNWSPLSRV